MIVEGLRAAGWSVSTLVDHFGSPNDQFVSDTEWLALAGELGLAVLMKDKNIGKREVELRALSTAGVHAFCLGSQSLPGKAQADLFLKHEAFIFQTCATPGPSLYILSQQGRPRRVEL